MSDPLERTRPMNYMEACRRARELWGERGHAEWRSKAPLEQRCVVGTVGAEPGKARIGRGATWEEAFFVALIAIVIG